MNNKPSPTIYDVATAAQVSISTVSRVLNNPEKVNDVTRSSVLEAINKLGFVPKAEARARALKEFRRIGVLTPFFTAPSFVQRLRGVASALQPTNYELIIFAVDSLSDLNSYLETLPLTGNLNGLIVLSLQFNDHYARHLVDHGLETVLIEYPQRILSSVEIDDVAGGRMAAEYLLQKGHRKLGFAGDTTIPDFGIHPISLRLRGFREGLQDAGVRLEEENILLVTYDVESTRKKAHEFLTSPQRPTGMFAATDLQAIGILRAARDLGLRVPQDLAILGFDDLDVAEYTGLTTISQHLDESGRVAVELLLSRLVDPTRSIQHIQIPLTIVERETAN
jgi:LacI family transcriptional regulator, galactose operon repressor